MIEAAGWIVLAKVLGSETNMMAAFGKSLFGAAALIVSVIIIAPECVGWAVAPVHRLLDSILLPLESEPPPADFTLARYYSKQMRYAEACVEYSKIIRYHPEQAVACYEGIVAASKAHGFGTANKLYRLGRRRVRLDEEKHFARQSLSTLPDAGDGRSGKPISADRTRLI